MPAIQAAVDSFQKILEDLTPEEISPIAAVLDRLNHRVEPTPEDSLVRSLTGRTWSQAEKLQLELDTLFNYFNKRKELLAGALSASEVAKLLGTSRQTPHDRIESKTLLGLLDRGSYRFPLWQFDPEGPDGVIDGLPAVLKALDLSDFAKLNWLVRPNPILDGLTPITALQQGQKDRIVREAAAVGIR
jgi:hypothetical protein